jgi:hypothetical protein
MLGIVGSYQALGMVQHEHTLSCFLAYTAPALGEVEEACHRLAASLRWAQERSAAQTLG